MYQFTVEKQGSLEFSHWSDRLLTVDSVNHFAFLTKKGQPHRLSYHKIRITELQMWPHYKPRFIDEDPNSLSAQLTVRLKGVVTPVTAQDTEHLARLDQQPRRQKWSRQLVSERYANKVPWMLRFQSLEMLQRFFFVMRQMSAQAVVPSHHVTVAAAPGARAGGKEASSERPPSELSITSKDVLPLSEGHTNSSNEDSPAPSPTMPNVEQGSPLPSAAIAADKNVSAASSAAASPNRVSNRASVTVRDTEASATQKGQQAKKVRIRGSMEEVKAGGSAQVHSSF